jgi:two-component system NtrC family sensor kinase
MPGPNPDPASKLPIAIVGGGRRCLSILQMLESRRLRDVKAEIVGVADIDSNAVGFQYAQQKGIFTTRDYRRLYEIPDLSLLINLTGNQELGRELEIATPEHLPILNYTASRLFQEIVSEVLSSSRQIAQQEDELSRSQSFLRAMGEATVVGVMELDTQFRINWINEAALKWYGLERNDALGRYCFQVSHQSITPCDSFENPCPMKKTLATGQSAHAIHEHIQHDQSPQYCDISTFPMFNKKGDVVGGLEVIRDITSEMNEKLESRTRSYKEDLARLIQEDKLIALGKLVASVAHEINNPIAAIINFAMLMLRTVEEGSLKPDDLIAFEKYLSLTVREANRCGKIVSNLLSFARQQPIEPKVLDLCAMLDSIIVLTRHKMELSNVDLILDLPDEKLEIWGDHTQIQQCLINLIFNAMEAMPDGGRLTIRAKQDNGGHRVALEVIDTGMGIPSENLTKIFEPFFSTKDEFQGVGLGLSMVHGIIREHQGEISVQSEPGHGAAFRITLPHVPLRENQETA